MQGIKVISDKKNLVIKVDKSLIDSESVIEMLNWFDTEQLARKVNFDMKILNIGKQIKKEWWEKNRKSFLEGS
jgi:hypothetical protein